jgi:AcrR family transcriptional regulator
MTGRGRPRQFDLDDALDQALSLFWRDGYEGASVNAIAAAVGVNKPSLYAAFGDKEALYLRALARYGEQQRARQAHVLDAEPDARTAVEAFLLSVVGAHADSAQPAGCMVVTGTTTCDGPAVPGSVKRALCRALQSAGGTIEARLARAQREGQLAKTVDIAALATFFSTVMAGLSVQAKGRQSRNVLRGVVAAAMRAWPSSRTPPRRQPRASDRAAQRRRGPRRSQHRA